MVNPAQSWHIFGLFGSDSSDSEHEQAIEHEIFEASLDPTREIVAADHTDERHDPEPIGGRIPDYVERNPITGEVTAVEKENNPESARSRDQMQDLRQGADDLGFDVEIESVWDDDDSWF